MGETESIQRFEQELQKYSVDYVGCVVIGDMNVHNPAWLRWSTHNSREGTELENVCSANGLRQLVKDPTRGDALLDLVLTDFESGVRAKVTPGIHDDDHCGVLCAVGVSIPAVEPVQRRVYNFKQAKWKK